MLADRIRVFEDDRENEAFAAEISDLAERCEVEGLEVGVSQETDGVIFSVVIKGKGQQARAAKAFGFFNFNRATAMDHFSQVLGLWRKKIFAAESAKASGKKLAIG